MSTATRLRHYTGLKSNLRRLEQLLGQFRFESVRSVLGRTVVASTAGGGVMVDLATEADAAAWDAYVDVHPDATGYHTWAWRHVFKHAFGHESIYLSARDGDRITGVLPLVHINSPLFGQSLTSLPFLNYGGIVADSDAIAAPAALTRRLKWRGAALPARGAAARRARFPRLPCRQHKVTMLLPLAAGMWERLDRKVRNQIRKAQKSELTLERGGAELLDDFYRCLRATCAILARRSIHAALFEEVLRAFPRAGAPACRAAGGASHRGRPDVSERGQTVEVPWASSIRDYNTLCPNHLLYWSVIESRREQGCDVLDFGRSTPGRGHIQVQGAVGRAPVPLHWEYVVTGGPPMPEIAAGNPKFKLMVEAWTRLPLALATALGPRHRQRYPMTSTKRFSSWITACLRSS